MGEISEMMLEGTLCQCCGVYIGLTPDDEDYKAWQPPGYPEFCNDCEGGNG